MTIGWTVGGILPCFFIFLELGTKSTKNGWACKIRRNCESSRKSRGSEVGDEEQNIDLDEVGLFEGGDVLMMNCEEGVEMIAK